MFPEIRKFFALWPDLVLFTLTSGSTSSLLVSLVRSLLFIYLMDDLKVKVYLAFIFSVATLPHVKRFFRNSNTPPPYNYNGCLVLTLFDMFPEKIMAFPWSGEKLCRFCWSWLAKSLYNFGKIATSGGLRWNLDGNFWVSMWWLDPI